MAWTYRALGRFREAAAAADSALRLDSTSFASSATNRLFALLEAGDTAAALAFANRQAPPFAWLRRQAEYQTALMARDWPRALAAYADTASGGDPLHPALIPYHHAALLVGGRLRDAAALLPVIERLWPSHQFTPRAIWLQARAALERGGSHDSASVAARRVLAWVEAEDLSAPAIARLAEHVAELAARAGDSVTIAATRRLLVRRDGDRDLPSDRLALLTVDAATAFVRGDMRTAANFAAAARAGMFHGRSLALTALLEADARASLGEKAAASALYEQLRSPDAFAASDIETWAILEPAAERGAARLARH